VFYFGRETDYSVSHLWHDAIIVASFQVKGNSLSHSWHNAFCIVLYFVQENRLQYFTPLA
jgi:hypothetical protein